MFGLRRASSKARGKDGKDDIGGSVTPHPAEPDRAALDREGSSLSKAPVPIFSNISSKGSTNKHGVILHVPLQLPDDPSLQPSLWSDMMAGSPLLSTMGSDERHREELIYELIQTEKSYLHKLAIIQRLFRQTCIDNNACTAEEIAVLFGNIDHVFAISEAMCTGLGALQLVHTGAKMPGIGETFLEFFSDDEYREVYATYCVRQGLATYLYQKLVKVAAEPLLI